MADVNSSSWTCVSGDKVAVFDDVSSVLMTPSPEEVLKNGERLTRQQTFTKEDSANEVDGVMFSGFNDHRQNLTFRDSSIWFRLESAYNPMNREDVYHVVKDVRGMASKELRINDRLVSLNDANTRVKSLQDVELMWEQLEKSPVIQMGIWRWMFNNTGSQIYEITIAFYNSHNSGSNKELSSLYLGRKSSRNVKNLQWTSFFQPFCLRIVCRTGTYVSANVEDLNLRGDAINPQKNRFRFLLRFFECMVQNEDGKTNKRFGFVGKFKINGKCFDISSALSELSSTVILRPHTIFKRSNPDERFFVTYKVEKDDDVFESLLYENIFLKFNIETETITMHERQARSPLFLFQRFVARDHVLPQVDINAFSDEVRSLSFVPLDDGEDDDSDDDNLDDDSDDNVVLKSFIDS